MFFFSAFLFRGLKQEGRKEGRKEGSNEGREEGRKGGRKEGRKKRRNEETKKGRKKGRNEEGKEGRKKGRKEGRKKGRKEGRTEERNERKEGQKKGMKGSKEGSKKKAKKRDELGVSHSDFQALGPEFSVPASPTFPLYLVRGFAPSCDYYTSRCSLWLSRPWVFRAAPTATATASGGEAPPNPPPALLDF